MTAEELLRFSAELRRGNKEYLSNAFFTLPQLEMFLSKPGVTACCTADLAVICEENADLLRVYLYARSGEALRDLKELLPSIGKPIIADVVGKEPAAGRLSKQMCENGFIPIYMFERMICTISADQPLPRADGAEKIEYATAADAPEILAFLYTVFDPLHSHFPSIDELVAAADKGEITVIRCDGAIAGLAFFEKVSELYCVLRHFMVQKRNRGRNLGGALLHRELSRATPGTVYMLWVEKGNSVTKLYERVGFQYDGLVDHILIFGVNKNGDDLRNS